MSAEMMKVIFCLFVCLIDFIEAFCQTAFPGSFTHNQQGFTSGKSHGRQQTPGREN